MNSDSSAYVFVSAEGAFRGFSRLPDGVNLPKTDGIAWLLNDTRLCATTRNAHRQSSGRLRFFG